MKFSLFRAKTFSVKLTKPGTSRAFVFDVEVGVGRGSGEIDPLSGMLVNLTEVDTLLAALADFWRQGPPPSWYSLENLLTTSRDFMENALQARGCFLQELCLREKRGFWLGSRRGALFMGREVIREYEGELCHFRWERPLQEAELETHDLVWVRDLFVTNPDLNWLEIENFQTGEKCLNTRSQLLAEQL